MTVDTNRDSNKGLGRDVTFEVRKLPTWSRVLQIVLGGIAIALSGYVLVHPILTTLFLLVFLGVSFIVVGTSNIIRAVSIKSLSKGHRVIDVVIGSLAIIGGFIALVQPLAALISLIWLVTLFVFMYGVGLVTIGATRKDIGKGARIATVIFGGIVLALSGLLLVFPGLSLVTAVVLLSFALVFNGIDRIVYGAIGYGLFLKSDKNTGAGSA